MIEKIVSLALHRRMVAIVIAVLVALYGYYSWTQLKIEAYPDISDVTVQVTTQALGYSAEDVEQQITIPLERTLSATPGSALIRSSSTFGLSLITIIFADGIELYWARQRVLELLNQVTLPTGITSQLDPVTGPVDEIYRYTLQSDTKNLQELSEIQRWKVALAIQRIPGVANVDTFGGLAKQYSLELDPIELNRYGLALSDVVSAINNNTSNSGGSRIARGEQSYVIRGIGLVRTLEDLGNIVVSSRHGSPILVRDLGRLEYSHQERNGILGQDRNPEAVQGNVQMLKGQNASRVLSRVHAEITKLNAELAREDVRIVPYIDRDGLVQATVNKVAHTMLEGVGLVFIILILFLGSPRSAAVVSVTIPMALLVAFILMQLTGLPANLLSLGSIDFGVIVDGAIVVTEAILRRREEAPDEPLQLVEIQNTAVHVTRPIFFATLIIITAYLPLLGLERAEAKLFSPIAYTIAYALVGALGCSLLLVPGLAFIAFRKPRRNFHNRVVRGLEAGYRASLSWLLGARFIVYAAVGCAFGGVVVLGVTAGREFLPELDEGALWLQVQLPSGISLDKASEMAGDLRRAIIEFPEVDTVITQLGRSDTRTDPWTFSHIEVPVTLKPYDVWPDSESKREFVARLRARLDLLPGFRIGISQPIIDNVNDLVAGAHSALVLRVTGDDLIQGRELANKIVSILRNVRGTDAANIFQEPRVPQISISVDRAAAARYGINVADISNLITQGVGGEPIGQVYNEDRVYSLTVRFPEKDRTSPSALGDLTLNAPGGMGMQVPLSQIATIRMQSGESTIAHEATKRSLSIAIEYRDRDLSSYLTDAQAAVASRLEYDRTKFSLQWAGQFENQARAQRRLSIIMGVEIGIMLAFLYVNFGNLRQALLVIAVIPLATLGGLIAVHLRMETLNVASGVGFIALFGVAVQNGIIMIANLNRVRDQIPYLREAVLEGATERLRPVLMTTLAASFGMVPAALATGIGSDVQRSIGTVVVGGLAVATALTLFIVPVLYYAIERRWHGRVLADSPAVGQRHPL